jgi:G3E family GTPase
VIRPLRAHFGERFEVAPLAVFVEPARLRELQGANEAGPLIAYLFDKQLEDAHLLVLTKLDTLGRSDQAELMSGLEQRYPSAEVLCVSARTGDGMPALRDRLLGASGSPAEPGVRSIDYATYAEAEAELAWLNAEVMIRVGAEQSVYPVEWLRAFTAVVANHCAARQLWIGHVKAHLATATGGSKASVLRAGQSPSFDLEDPRPFLDGRLLVNARVRAHPNDLEDIVRTSLAWVDDHQRTRSTVALLRSFRPPPPRPTHRLGPP